MAQLVEAIEGMSDACRFFDTPITGGNVSLYNETLGVGIYPTPVIGIVGLMKTAAPVTIPFKHAGRSVILLGGPGPATTSASAARSTPRKSNSSFGACRPRSIWTAKSACSRPSAKSSPRASPNRRTI